MLGKCLSVALLLTTAPYRSYNCSTFASRGRGLRTRILVSTSPPRNLISLFCGRHRFHLNALQMPLLFCALALIALALLPEAQLLSQRHATLGSPQHTRFPSQHTTGFLLPLCLSLATPAFLSILTPASPWMVTPAFPWMFTPVDLTHATSCSPLLCAGGADTCAMSC